ncbi:Major exported protein [compost metagenome]
MAFHSYMSITGKRQGLISAGCSTESSIGNRYQAVHCDEIMVLSFKHQLTNLDNTRRASHQPVTLTKPIDKATPLLAQALHEREVVECLFNFYRIDAAGHHEKYFSIQLTGGLIVQHQVDVPHSVLMTDQDAQEYVSIRYRDISWRHHAASTGAFATWGDEQ